MQGVPNQLSQLPSYVIYILFNPALNPMAALIVYSAAALILLLVLAVGILLITRPRRDSGQTAPDEPAETPELAGITSTTRRRGPRFRREKGAPLPMSPRARLTVAGLVILVLIAAWVITGYTTSDPALCKNCHWPASAHATALAGTDLHANVSCVSCHESGGAVSRYLTGVPARLLHFADSQSETPQQGAYGYVTASACSACHEAALKGVASNAARGLRVSHKEPLAASAVCIDCHALRAGVVGSHNTGMAPCLRCHDAKVASAKCVTCHDEKAASAARVRTASFAKEQIPDVTCGGCHNEKRDCDGCHGVRLPHTTEFKMYAHARAGAVDFWYNGGKTCSRCHTASRRPCQQCHGRDMGHNHGTGTAWLARGHQSANVKACDTCHKQFAYTGSRDFCKDVCHTPAAVKASPR